MERRDSPRISGLCCSQSGQFCASVGERCRHEDGAEALEAVLLECVSSAQCRRARKSYCYMRAKTCGGVRFTYIEGTWVMPISCADVSAVVGFDASTINDYTSGKSVNGIDMHKNSSVPQNDKPGASHDLHHAQHELNWCSSSAARATQNQGCCLPSP